MRVGESYLEAVNRVDSKLFGATLHFPITAWRLVHSGLEVGGRVGDWYALRWLVSAWQQSEWHLVRPVQVSVNGVNLFLELTR